MKILLTPMVMFVLCLAFIFSQGRIKKRINRGKSESYEWQMKILLSSNVEIRIEETLKILLDSSEITNKLKLITTIIWSLIEFDVNCFGK